MIERKYSEMTERNKHLEKGKLQNFDSIDWLLDLKRPVDDGFDFQKRLD